MKRLYLAHYIFSNRYFSEKYVVWLDETHINDDVYKQYQYSEKNTKKILHNRK